MPFPFVSRSLYEKAEGEVSELKAKVSALEIEKQKLLDRIMELSSQRPIYHVPQTPASAEADSEPMKPVPTRVTMERVRTMANAAAERFAAGAGPALWKKREVRPRVG